MLEYKKKTSKGAADFNRNDPNVSPGCLKFVAIMVGAVTLEPSNGAQKWFSPSFSNPWWLILIG